MGRWFIGVGGFLLQYACMLEGFCPGWVQRLSCAHSKGCEKSKGVQFVHLKPERNRHQPIQHQ
jgi:hypothetical protein